MSDKNKNDTIQDNPGIERRRRAVRSILTGSAAVVTAKHTPEAWVKPVIDGVILPAHASTTDDSGSSGGDGTTVAPTTEAPTTTGCPAGSYLTPELSDRSAYCVPNPTSTPPAK